MGTESYIEFEAFAFGLGRKFSNVRPRRISSGSTVVSRGGISESLEYGVWDEVEVEIDILRGTGTEKAVALRMAEWWSYARRGGQYKVAFDIDKKTSTTLDGAANFGQKVIPLTSTTGFVAGDICIVTGADLINRAVVQIASISAGVSVTVSTDLLRAFSSGDEFRHHYYWPKAVSLDREQPFYELRSPPGCWRFSHRFREDRG